MKSPDRKRALELSFEMGFVEGTIAGTQRLAEVSEDIVPNVIGVLSGINDLLAQQRGIELATAELKQAENSVVRSEQSVLVLEGRLRGITQNLREEKEAFKIAKETWMEKVRAQDSLIEAQKLDSGTKELANEIARTMHAEFDRIRNMAKQEVAQLVLDRQRYALGLQSIISAEEVSEEEPPNAG